MGHDKDEAYHEMMAHVPLFVHPNPKTALVIGDGENGTAREILRHPSIETCVRVEKEFIPQTAEVFGNPRLKKISSDGGNWIQKVAHEKFDVICVDSPDPADFKKLLRPNGILVAQGESPFYSQENQKALAQKLKIHFKRVHFYNFTHKTYPGGLWSFAFASDAVHPLDDLSSSRVTSSGLEMNWYNLGIHEASFLLPQFQRENLKDYLNPI